MELKLPTSNRSGAPEDPPQILCLYMSPTTNGKEPSFVAPQRTIVMLRHEGPARSWKSRPLRIRFGADSLAGSISLDTFDSTDSQIHITLLSRTSSSPFAWPLRKPLCHGALVMFNSVWIHYSCFSLLECLIVFGVLFLAGALWVPCVRWYIACCVEAGVYA